MKNVPCVLISLNHVCVPHRKCVFVLGATLTNLNSIVWKRSINSLSSLARKWPPFLLFEVNAQNDFFFLNKQLGFKQRINACSFITIVLRMNGLIDIIDVIIYLLLSNVYPYVVAAELSRMFVSINFKYSRNPPFKRSYSRVCAPLNHNPYLQFTFVLFWIQRS